MILGVTGGGGGLAGLQEAMNDKYEYQLATGWVLEEVRNHNTNCL